MAKALFRDETGATGIEYGLILSLVAMAAMTGFDQLGKVVDGSFGETAERYEEVTAN
ncbi:Flp family type IVb pilin [Aurantiacibacter hainanensis]|uniref:Flp family type IVb pilin n=1 Tax=Aurantiacibacter hainanensis TaxID=3076114 RepID=UPI0030C74312